MGVKIQRKNILFTFEGNFHVPIDYFLRQKICKFVNIYIDKIVKSLPRPSKSVADFLICQKCNPYQKADTILIIFIVGLFFQIPPEMGLFGENFGTGPYFLYHIFFFQFGRNAPIARIDAAQMQDSCFLEKLFLFIIKSFIIIILRFTIISFCNSALKNTLFVMYQYFAEIDKLIQIPYI